MNVSAVAAVKDCRVTLGDRAVLDGVTLEMFQGEFIALLGPNGSGKTTLVRAMLGLQPRRSGKVELFGTPLERFRRWERIGYVPQRFGAASGVPATVEEIVLTGRIPLARRGRRYSHEDRKVAAAALEAVDLAAFGKRRISALSGGQHQRVLIARALVNQPELLILDEPVSNVDLAHQASFAELLRRLPSSGTVLLLAHSLGLMQPLVDRTIVLDEGRVVYDGLPRPEHMHAEEHHHFEENLRP